MNCACGETVKTYDAFECERLAIGKTMCRACRAIFLEFHEKETDTETVLKSHRMKILKKLAGVL